MISRSPAGSIIKYSADGGDTGASVTVMVASRSVIDAARVVDQAI
jgi:hypothetical protein